MNLYDFLMKLTRSVTDTCCRSSGCKYGFPQISCLKGCISVALNCKVGSRFICTLGIITIQVIYNPQGTLCQQSHPNYMHQQSAGGTTGRYLQVNYVNGKVL